MTFFHSLNLVLIADIDILSELGRFLSRWSWDATLDFITNRSVRHILWPHQKLTDADLHIPDPQVQAIKAGRVYALVVQLNAVTSHKQTMSSSTSTTEARTRNYSQQLAAYTLRQFNVALASLDTQETAGLSKIPSVHSRVSRAEQASTSESALFLLS